VIGAAAMAVHGVSRATRDIDLFTLARECLEPSFWTSLGSPAGIEALVREGDATDPLAGVVRLTAPGENPLDVVVGKSSWQATAIARAQDAVIEDVRIRVAGPLDLILLKLYAGGPQDAWDIEQLLTGSDEHALAAQVDGAVAALPPDGQALWARIRAGRRPA
jgi:hypothetical protein